MLQLRTSGEDLTEFGTPQSGHWGHRGRPGERGGSLPNDAVETPKEPEKYVTFYHGTTEIALRGIAKEGLRPDVRRVYHPDFFAGSRADGVFVVKAGTYTNKAGDKVFVPQEAARKNAWDWGKFAVSILREKGHDIDSIIVFKIVVPKIEADKFKPDEVIPGAFYRVGGVPADYIKEFWVHPAPPNDRLDVGKINRDVRHAKLRDSVEHESVFFASVVVIADKEESSQLEFGTKKSGHWGHKGIPGHRGGSAKNDEPGPVTRVGITSYSTGRGYTSVHAVYRDMEVFHTKLKSIDGVTDVSVKFGVGVWEGGREPSWVVSYRGNGKAQALIAKTAKDRGQEGVLLLRPPMEGNSHPIVEFKFEERVTPENKKVILNAVTSEGIGLTWHTMGGKQVLFVTAVPEFGNRDEQVKIVSEKIRGLLGEMKLVASYREGAVSTEVMGPDNYDKYIQHEGKLPDVETIAIFFKKKKKKRTESVLEYGVKGRSGHWGHKSQKGHRGGSLPKDGQLALSLEPGHDTKPPEMKTPQFGDEARRLMDKIERETASIPGIGLPLSNPPKDMLDKTVASIKKVFEIIPDEYLAGLDEIKVVSKDHYDALFHSCGYWNRNEKKIVITPENFEKHLEMGHIAGFDYARVYTVEDSFIIVGHEIGHHIWYTGLSVEEEATVAKLWNETRDNMYTKPQEYKIARDYGIRDASEFFAVNLETYIAGRYEFIGPAMLKFLDERFKRPAKRTESIDEYGVRGKSGHWGHKSQKGHRGGSLPKDGQGSLSFPDTKPPEMKTPEPYTAIHIPIERTPEYDKPDDPNHAVLNDDEKKAVDTEIQKILTQVRGDWADGMKIILFPQIENVPWGQYEEEVWMVPARCFVYVGHIKKDMGMETEPRGVHTAEEYPWGNWIEYTATCVVHEIGHHVWMTNKISRGAKNQFNAWFSLAINGGVKYPREYGMLNIQEFFTTNYEAWVRGHKHLMEPVIWDWFEENARPRVKAESFIVKMIREGASRVHYGFTIRTGPREHAEMKGGSSRVTGSVLPPIKLEYGVRGKSGHWGHKSQKGHRGGSLPKDGQGSLPFDAKPSAPPKMKSPEQDIDDLVAKIYSTTAKLGDLRYGVPSKTLDKLYDFKTQITQVFEQLPPGWGEGITSLTIRTVGELPGGFPKKMEGDEDVAGEYYVGDKKIDIWFEPGYDHATYSGIRGIVTHEVGHHIWYTKLSDVERERFKRWYDRAKSGFDIYPTRYSLKNESEFFCENLRYYVIGKGQELLSTEVFEWMERNVGSLSFRGIRPLKPSPQYPKGLPDRELALQYKRTKMG